jgi:hypothetical protein
MGDMKAEIKMQTIHSRSMTDWRNNTEQKIAERELRLLIYF